MKYKSKDQEPGKLTIPTLDFPAKMKFTSEEKHTDPVSSFHFFTREDEPRKLSADTTVYRKHIISKDDVSEEEFQLMLKWAQLFQALHVSVFLEMIDKMNALGFHLQAAFKKTGYNPDSDDL